MIDGPHRSLPLKRHWRDFMLCADKEAYSLEERCQSLSIAVKKEFSSSVLTAVRDVLDEREQGLPSIVDPIERIETIQENYPGSTADSFFIEEVICGLLKGETSQKVLEDGLKNACERLICAHFRSIEEHQCRKELKTIGYLRKRMYETAQETKADFIVSELIKDLDLKKNVQKPSKRTGLDEGPEL